MNVAFRHVGRLLLIAPWLAAAVYAAVWFFTPPKPKHWAILATVNGSVQQLSATSQTWRVVQGGSMTTCVEFANDDDLLALVCGVELVTPAE